MVAELGLLSRGRLSGELYPGAFVLVGLLSHPLTVDKHELWL